MRLNFSIIIAIASIIVCVLIIPDKFETFDEYKNILFTFISLFNIVVYFSTVKRFYSSWVRYDVLFIVGFLIVHFQIPFLEAIGISPQRPDYIWINKRVVNFASWFSTLVLLLWMIGFYLFLLKKRKGFRIEKRDYYIKESPFLKILLILSFGVFLMIVGESFLAGNHAGHYNWGSGATYAYLILRVTIILSVIYFFINNKNKLNSIRDIFIAISANKLLFGISILYCLMFLYVGDRGPIMEIGIIYLTGYTLFNREISLTKLVLFLFIGATFFTIIRYGRSRDVSFREDNVIVSGYQNLKNQDNPFNPTDELASSVRILYRAIDVVPSKHSYLYGITLVSNIIDVIPFSSTFYNIPKMYSNSTVFFTILGQGEFYTYGEGSEIIADLYINLGFWFTLMIFLLFGYFISFVTFDAHYKRNHSLLIMYIILIALAIYINRSNFLNPLKLIVYALVFDKFLTKKIKGYQYNME